MNCLPKALARTIDAAQAGRFGDGIDALLLEAYADYQQAVQTTPDAGSVLQEELRLKMVAIVPTLVPGGDTARWQALNVIGAKLPEHTLDAVLDSLIAPYRHDKNDPVQRFDRQYRHR